MTSCLFYFFIYFIYFCSFWGSTFWFSLFVFLIKFWKYFIVCVNVMDSGQEWILMSHDASMMMSARAVLK